MKPTSTRRLITPTKVTIKRKRLGIKLTLNQTLKTLKTGKTTEKKHLI
jgi:hypothetical protein